ncbi:hypothetical protein [Haloarcula salina]|uniref:Uncharacterized protein n=1 Tax=Haloarcula salina TaxID=1429914 RepID=A0AA41KEI0_9EURY|nr:hypothetical protein [Haloarcula salina]MBV0900897.1 hypothetical protein [Haloarcula salina]
MSLSRTALVAGLDALPFAALASLATVVFARAGDQPPEFVAPLAGVVGTAALLGLGTISANRYRQTDTRFYFTRAVVVEGLLSLP